MVCDGLPRCYLDDSDMFGSRRWPAGLLFLPFCFANPCGLWLEPAQLHYLDDLRGADGEQFGDMRIASFEKGIGFAHQVMYVLVGVVRISMIQFVPIQLG